MKEEWREWKRKTKEGRGRDGVKSSLCGVKGKGKNSKDEEVEEMEEAERK